MSTYKVIISGRLEFANARSFEQVMKTFEHQLENYYKRDIMLKGEDIFMPDTHSLDVPRAILQVGLKTWRNTMNLLRQVAEFAIAGDISSWVVENGQVLHRCHIEPEGDKSAVQAFLQGRALVMEAGREEDAHKALSRAIDKFARHALAYERRGFVNFQLGNHADALYDYNKSIDINPNRAEPFFGRACIHIAKDDYKQAIPDLEQAIKHVIPLQTLHWKCRHIKGKCHLQLGEYEQAAKELGFFTRRAFPEDDPNLKHLRKALLQLGDALTVLGKHAEAVAAYDKALATPHGTDEVKEADILTQRGIALKKAGKDGFLADWKAAAKQGSEKAAELLETA